MFGTCGAFYKNKSSERKTIGGFFVIPQIAMDCGQSETLLNLAILSLTILK